MKPHTKITAKRKFSANGTKDMVAICFFLKEYMGNFKKAVCIPNIVKTAPNLNTETIEDILPIPSEEKK